MSNSPVTDLVLRDVPFDSPEAAALIAELQQEYVTRYGGSDQTPIEVGEFGPPNGLFLVAEVGGEPAGCAGLRAQTVGGVECAEMKRMYVRPAFRRHGLARKLLASVEQRAALLGYPKLILETGDRRPAAGGRGALPERGLPAARRVRDLRPGERLAVLRQGPLNPAAPGPGSPKTRDDREGREPFSIVPSSERNSRTARPAASVAGLTGVLNRRPKAFRPR